MTHETYPICASSDEERAEWVHAIKKVMYYDKGGGECPQTGRRLGAVGHKVPNIQTSLVGIGKVR